MIPRPIREVIAHLERAGYTCTRHRVNKHCRLYLVRDGVEFFIITSASPSDCTRWHRNVIADADRTFARRRDGKLNGA